MPIARANIPLTNSDVLGVIADLITPRSLEKDAEDILAFETAFAARYDAPPAVSFCKARMAFYHLLRSFELAEDQQVIISSLHIGDFVNMILLAGLKPVIVDVAKNGYNVDFEDLERKITEQTGLIVVTHLAGYPTDMTRVTSIVDRRNILILEDCSQSVTSTFNGRLLGTYGEASIFSLSLLKSVCTLNGGLVVTKNRELHDRLVRATNELPKAPKIPLLSEAIKNLILIIALSFPVFDLIVFPLLRLKNRRSDFLAKYQKTNKTVTLRKEIPKNFMTGFSGAQARLGLKLLSSLSQNEKRRIRNGRALYDILKQSGTACLPVSADVDGTTFWLFPIFPKNPNALRSKLISNGFDCSPMLLSNLSQVEAFNGISTPCPNATHFHTNTVFVPAHGRMSPKEISKLAEIIIQFENREDA